MDEGFGKMGIERVGRMGTLGGERWATGGVKDYSGTSDKGHSE